MNRLRDVRRFARPMTGTVLSLLAGLLAGFLGAIPPGPINVTVIRKASARKEAEALRVGFGGALVDGLICAFVAMGFGWALSSLTAHRGVKLVLALFLLAYGVKILVVDLRRDAEARAEEALRREKHHAPQLPPKGERWGMPLVVGLVQGAANPTLIVNWTLVIGFLVGQRVIQTDVLSGGAFALGVASGVFAWFALLARLVVRMKDHPAGEWLRHSTTLAGILLVAFGLAFSVKTLVGG